MTGVQTLQLQKNGNIQVDMEYVKINMMVEYRSTDYVASSM